MRVNLNNCPTLHKRAPPSRRFRPYEEDGVVEIEGELKARLRLANGKANKGVSIAG